MQVRKAQKLRNALLLTGTALMLGAYFYAPLFGWGMAVACASLIPHFLYNKCPYCKKQLGNNEAGHCQHCGAAIDESTTGD